MRLLICFILFLLPFQGIGQKKFEKFLKSNTKLKPLLEQAQNYRIQIIYTPIRSNNKPGKTRFFNYEPQTYFYPASTVKFPVAILSLEKLKKLGQSSTSTLKTYEDIGPYESDSVGQSIRNYVKEIFLLSDNTAFNRLYDFLGQDKINQSLKGKGYLNSEILHRLSVSLTPAQNSYKPKLSVGSKYFEPAETSSSQPNPRANALLGKAYYQGDSLVTKPMDFSNKNKFDLFDQHQMLMDLFYPKAQPSFDLKSEDLDFVKQIMHQMPRQNGYKEEEYPDNYVKFLVFGDQTGRIPEHIKIYNKIGQAYGFLTDNALIEDSQKGKKFLLSATILCNSDQVFNDDQYDYETVGFPFLGELGRYLLAK